MSEDEVFSNDDPFVDLVAKDEAARRAADQLATRKDAERLEFILRFERTARDIIEPEFDRAVSSVALKQRGLTVEKEISKLERLHEVSLIIQGLKTEYCTLTFRLHDTKIYRHLGCRHYLAKEKTMNDHLGEDDLTAPGAVRKMVETFVSRVLEANR